jgi:hypothetical protein
MRLWCAENAKQSFAGGVPKQSLGTRNGSRYANHHVGLGTPRGSLSGADRVPGPSLG